MAKVSLHIYDITNSPDPKTNNMIMQLNRITRDGMGLGGIFHGAIEVYGEEWSYGFCEKGSGVFSCRPKANPSYSWRETIELGVTPLDWGRTERLIVALSEEWEGLDYDLLQHNCNHFCDELSLRLGTGKIPIWVNRLANLGDSAAEFAASSAIQIQAIQSSLYGAGQAAYRLFWGASDSGAQAPDPAEPISRGEGPSHRWTNGASSSGDHMDGRGSFSTGSGNGAVAREGTYRSWSSWSGHAGEEDRVRDRLGLLKDWQDKASGPAKGPLLYGKQRGQLDYGEERSLGRVSSTNGSGVRTDGRGGAGGGENESRERR